jgi:hypothetical protein
VDMPSIPHVCPLRDIPSAARTITTVMCQSNPLIAFVYNFKKDRELPVPYGKRELLSVYLYQLRTNGIVLTVDDDDQKCIGVAVWTGPNCRKGVVEKVRAWFILLVLNVWLFFSMLYYGSEMSPTVNSIHMKLIVEERGLRTGLITNQGGDIRRRNGEKYVESAFRSGKTRIPRKRDRKAAD